MQAIISAITTIVDGSADWISSTGNIIANTPMLLFMVLVSFVGIGIGLFKRLTRI